VPDPPGLSHKFLAEQRLRDANPPHAHKPADRSEVIAEAQVHATLALLEALHEIAYVADTNGKLVDYGG
jgi:hypothetical protein